MDGRPSDASAWLGARVRLAGSGNEGDVELGPAVRFAIPMSADAPPLRLDGGLALGADLGDGSFLFNAGTRLQLEEGAIGPYALPFTFVGGATYDFFEWFSGTLAADFAIVMDGDVYGCVECTGGPRPNAGLGFGLELGEAIYGTLSGHVSPFEAPFGGFSGELGVGLRDPR